jgi:Na+/proline symporter
MVILIGIAVHAHVKGIDPDLAFMVGMQEYLIPALVAFAIIMLFAGLMSSLDSIIYGTSSHFAFLLHKKEST